MLIIKLKQSQKLIMNPYVNMKTFCFFIFLKTFIGKMAITYLIKITIVINGLLVKIPK